MRCRNNFIKRAIDDNSATEMYNFLRYNIEWKDGIKSKKTGFTIKAKAIDPGEKKLNKK